MTKYEQKSDFVYGFNHIPIPVNKALRLPLLPIKFLLILCLHLLDVEMPKFPEFLGIIVCRLQVAYLFSRILPKITL